MTNHPNRAVKYVLIETRLRPISGGGFLPTQYIIDLGSKAEIQRKFEILAKDRPLQFNGQNDLDARRTASNLLGCGTASRDLVVTRSILTANSVNAQPLSGYLIDETTSQ